jgi:hypothetical protein
MWSGKIVLLLLWLVKVVVGTRGGGSCAAARKCCDGKDPDCAVPSVSEEDASKRHGEKRQKSFASINCNDLLNFIQNCLLSFSSLFILFYYDLLQCLVSSSIPL